MSNKKNTIRKIHESKFKASIVATGGGANFIADLLSISGASNTILESYVPYSRKSIDINASSISFFLISGDGS